MLRVFAEWMSQQHLPNLHEVTDQQLDRYRQHVLRLEASTHHKSHLFIAVRTVWDYRGRLPPHCRLNTHSPWGGTPPARLAAAASRPAGTENTTPRVAAATMEALLDWSLRMVEVIGPDIVAARAELDQLEAGTHPSQRAFDGLTSRQRLQVFAADAVQRGHGLPGHPRRNSQEQPRINWSQLARMLQLPQRQVPASLQPVILDSDLPIDDGSPVGTITGLVQGHPWRERPATTQELPGLVSHLSVACFVIISYLSGMRPGEVLNLRRGCTRQDETTGQLLVAGRYGKGHARTPRPTLGDDPWERTWVVVRPVHQAIALLERLTDGSPFLFPSSLHKPHAIRPADRHARRTGEMTRDLGNFIAWVNATFHRLDGDAVIPPDPAGRIYPSRFRRTLAYFIVRRPRGLIAAALQYGHVSTTVTLSYSGKADTGWLDDLAVERLEAILEHNKHDHALLAAGEHVSGPAATDYRDRVVGAHRFAGRVVNRVRNVERLLQHTDPSIHHGDGMTCVYRAETAVCRTSRQDQGLPIEDGPLEAECQTGCVNLAYTDRDIARLGERLAVLNAAADDSMAPAPLRDRAGAQAEQIRAVLNRHQTAPKEGRTP
ncbi:integrase [Nocardioides sp. Root151]|uniref:integrase n=1 Tax=Nocardioides sp. Root151 TaxID=1736475 RepID=UPI001F37E75A|nr:integrase [Nocardioides sp. Root151]